MGTTAASVVATARSRLEAVVRGMNAPTRTGQLGRLVASLNRAEQTTQAVRLRLGQVPPMSRSELAA